MSFTRNSKIRNSLKFNKNSDNKLLGNIILSFSQAGGRRFKLELTYAEKSSTYNGVVGAFSFTGDLFEAVPLCDLLKRSAIF